MIKVITAPPLAGGDYKPAAPLCKSEMTDFLAARANLRNSVDRWPCGPVTHLHDHKCQRPKWLQRQSNMATVAMLLDWVALLLPILLCLRIGRTHRRLFRTGKVPRAGQAHTCEVHCMAAGWG